MDDKILDIKVIQIIMRTPMRIFRYSIQKSLKLWAKYWEFLVIGMSFLILINYYYYYKEELSAYTEINPWKWPSSSFQSFKEELFAMKTPHFEKPNGSLESEIMTAEKLPTTYKLIMYSVPAFGEKTPYPVDPEKCGGKCVVSYNSSLLNAAHAVIFHIYDQRPIPPRRFANQLYVWNNQESPAMTFYQLGLPFERYNYVFNLTMTYRRESDLYFPYNTTRNVFKTIQNDSKFEDLNSFLASKKRLAAWVTGNHKTKGGGWRMRLVLKMLLVGLDIDIFGRSVFNRLPGHWMDVTKYLSSYKFYLSFENSYHCKDYITEKVWWNALQSGAVPVIWGPAKEDVEALLPEGSFILAENFKTVFDLVKYLNFLDKNPKKYSKYFQWIKSNPRKTISGRKPDFFGSDSDITGFCQLCKKLYEDDQIEEVNGVRPKHVIGSIQDWWYLNENEECLNGYSRVEFLDNKYYRNLLLFELWFGVYSYKYHYVIFYFVIILYLLYRFRRKP